jgi:hypothetical protein
MPPRKIFFDFIVLNKTPSLSIAKSKILSHLVFPMESTSKNKFKRSLLGVSQPCDIVLS